MHEGLSGRIVHFIASLHPLYEGVVLDSGSVAARSLTDGTMIYPIEEDEDNENGFVQVHWQGDSARSCEALGERLATLAVVRYVELYGFGFDQRAKREFEGLAHHFSFKTGGTLTMETPDGIVEAYALLQRLLQKSGTAVAIALLKKTIGL